MRGSNRQIALNTFYLYFRMAATMAVGLYTSRLVLQTLGVSDLGLYAVVGGILSMFTFISGSLSMATSRFLNAEMGRPDGDVNRCFNVNIALHTAFALMIAVMAETVGLWYVCHSLNVEPGKEGDAMFVYQVSVAVTCAGIVNSPYQSLFQAHERFRFLAAIDVANNILRLLCIVALHWLGRAADSVEVGGLTFSLLRLYVMIIAFSTATTFVAYRYEAMRRWGGTVRRRVVRGWHNYRDVLVFNNWNILATLAYMTRSSGSDLLINAFFGTAVNGACDVGRSVNRHVSAFSSVFDSASAPQIVQAYAAGDRERYTYLANKMGRINLLLFVIMFFPLYIELRYVLELWLEDVPEGVYEFAVLYLLIGGVSLSCGGIYNVINASGRIKCFKILVSVAFVSCVPMGYVLFAFGWPAYSILVLFLVMDVLQRAVQLCLMRRILGFDALRYARESYVRPLMISALMCGVVYVHSLARIDAVPLRLLSIAVCGVTVALLVYGLGLTAGERAEVRKVIRKFIVI